LRKGHYIIVFTGNYQERDSYLVRMQGGGIFFEHFLTELQSELQQELHSQPC
jgi:hypothetical protein